tara:strand:+ start:92 stop:274 length:183 start_codon:yes stop_codon:yes gene_type:complete
MNKINKKEIQLELPKVTISGYEEKPKYSSFENYLKDQFLNDAKFESIHNEIQLELSNFFE